MNFNDKQLQIISIAEELFASQGFEGTSVRDIAEAAGINIAMISYYFGSKEKLMCAIFDVRTGHIRMKVESLMSDNSLTSLQKMEHLIQDHISRVVENTRFYKIMMTEQLINKNGALFDLVKQVKKTNVDIIAQLIQQGVQNGEFNEINDVPIMMNTLIGTVSHTILNEQFYRAYHRLENVSDPDYKALIKQRLSNHISQIFKSMLLK
jgi:AcrR family transcriptional regulator